MGERLKVGVIGCGLIAQVMHLPHLLELDELYELAAVCDIAEPTATACALRYGDPEVFPSWERDCSRRRISTSVMVLTSGSHAPAAIAAARAGINVFVEKPMCLSVEEGVQMATAAQDADVRLMVGTMKRYDPAYERLLEVLPDAGELRLVRVMTLESPWKPCLENYALAAAG